MLRSAWKRRFVGALSLLLLVGCQPAEVGTIGPETKSDAPLPTGPDPSMVKGKNKPESNLETRETRK